MKDCPKCGRFSPASAERCDCGYKFAVTRYCPECICEYLSTEAIECSYCKVPLVSETALKKVKTEKLQHLQQRLGTNLPPSEKKTIAQTIKRLEAMDKPVGQEVTEWRVSRDSSVEGYDYLTLLSLGKVVSAIGWVVVALGVVGIAISVFQFVGGEKTAVLSLLGGIPTALLGVLAVAFGQQISCFVAIERNTRGTQELLRRMNEKAG